VRLHWQTPDEKRLADVERLSVAEISQSFEQWSTGGQRELEKLQASGQCWQYAQRETTI
jgi:hypothetical protein